MFVAGQDESIARKVLEIEDIPRYKAPLILEGGSFHVDGEGTVIVSQVPAGIVRVMLPMSHCHGRGLGTSLPSMRAESAVDRGHRSEGSNVSFF
jgi:hypothetical protein